MTDDTQTTSEEEAKEDLRSLQYPCSRKSKARKWSWRSWTWDGQLGTWGAIESFQKQEMTIRWRCKMKKDLKEVLFAETVQQQVWKWGKVAVEEVHPFYPWMPGMFFKVPENWKFMIFAVKRLRRLMSRDRQEERDNKTKTSPLQRNDQPVKEGMFLQSPSRLEIEENCSLCSEMNGHLVLSAERPVTIENEILRNGRRRKSMKPLERDSGTLPTIRSRGKTEAEKRSLEDWAPTEERLWMNYSGICWILTSTAPSVELCPCPRDAVWCPIKFRMELEPWSMDTETLVSLSSEKKRRLTFGNEINLLHRSMKWSKNYSFKSWILLGERFKINPCWTFFWLKKPERSNSLKSKDTMQILRVFMTKWRIVIWSVFRNLCQSRTEIRKVLKRWSRDVWITKNWWTSWKDWELRLMVSFSIENSLESNFQENAASAQKHSTTLGGWPPGLVICRLLSESRERLLPKTPSQILPGNGSRRNGLGDRRKIQPADGRPEHLVSDSASANKTLSDLFWRRPLRSTLRNTPAILPPTGNLWCQICAWQAQKFVEHKKAQIARQKNRGRNSFPTKLERREFQDDWGEQLQSVLEHNQNVFEIERRRKKMQTLWNFRKIFVCLELLVCEPEIFPFTR